MWPHGRQRRTVEDNSNTDLRKTKCEDVGVDGLGLGLSPATVFGMSGVDSLSFTTRLLLVLLHTMEALGRTGSIAPTHSRPRH
jgi:hypothetical protein